MSMQKNVSFETKILSHSSVSSFFTAIVLEVYYWTSLALAFLGVFVSVLVIKGVEEVKTFDLTK